MNQVISPVYKSKERGLEWLNDCSLPKKRIYRIKPKINESLYFPKGINRVFARYKIEENHYEKIMGYLKKHQVTMNDLILAVYYKAIRETFDFSVASICCIVNLRRYMKDSNQIGLFVKTLDCNWNFQSTDSFDESWNHRLPKHEISRNRDNRLLYISFVKKSTQLSISCKYLPKGDCFTSQHDGNTIGERKDPEIFSRLQSNIAGGDLFMKGEPTKEGN